jgi:hypothetical protein
MAKIVNQNSKIRVMAVLHFIKKTKKLGNLKISGLVRGREKILFYGFLISYSNQKVCLKRKKILLKPSKSHPSQVPQKSKMLY